MLGLGNDPGSQSWMTGSGVPWDARYQYLSAGVNTGYGWSTWNSPAGAFALWYMQNSGANNYVPVFSYYQMLQSSPASLSNSESFSGSPPAGTSTGRMRAMQVRQRRLSSSFPTVSKWTRSSSRHHFAFRCRGRSSPSDMTMR